MFIDYLLLLTSDIFVAMVNDSSNTQVQTLFSALNREKTGGNGCNRLLFFCIPKYSFNLFTLNFVLSVFYLKPYSLNMNCENIQAYVLTE